MKKTRPAKSGKKVEKKSTQKKKYPLRGKPAIYRDPFKDMETSDWEALK